MIQSINSKAELSVEATSYYSIAEYGKLLLGDKGFEFYCDRNIKRNIQIPWNEITCVSATVLFKKWIVRFCIHTKANGDFMFASKKAKQVLIICGNHIGKEHLVHSKTLLSRFRK